MVVDFSRIGQHRPDCPLDGPRGDCETCQALQQAAVCRAVGHADEYRGGRCGVCGHPTQYVRVEVTEGRAYTYQAFEDPPLAKGEVVLLPGNQVQSRPFTGTVLRLMDGPDDNYSGPYKAVVGRDLL